MVSKVFHGALLLTFALHYCFVLLLVGIPIVALVQRLSGRVEGAAWRFWR